MSIQVRGIIDQWGRTTVGPQASTTSIAPFTALNALIPAALPAAVAPAQPASGPGFAAGYGGTGGQNPLGEPNSTVAVEAFICTNTSGAAITVTIARVPSGVTQAAPAQDLFTAFSIPANTTTFLGSGSANPLLYLVAGDMVTVKASAAGINFSANVRVDRNDFMD
jgi:hypothetical protein